MKASALSIIPFVKPLVRGFQLAKAALKPEKSIGYETE